MLISEIFYSVQGEGTLVGTPGKVQTGEHICQTLSRTW